MSENYGERCFMGSNMKKIMLEIEIFSFKDWFSLPILGFAALRAWQTAFFFNPELSLREDFGFSFQTLVYFPALWTFLAVALLTCLFPRKFEALFAQKRFSILMAGALLVSSGLLYYFDISRASPFLLALITCCTAASAPLLIAWSHVYVRLEPRRVVFQSTLAVLYSRIICSVLFLLPAATQAIGQMLLPILSVAALLRIVFPDTSSIISKHPLTPSKLNSTQMRLLARFFIVVLAISIISVLGREASSIYSGPLKPTATVLLSFVGTTIPCLIILLLNAFKKDADFLSLWRLLFFLLFLSLAISLSFRSIYFQPLVRTMVNTCSDIIIWLATIRLCHEYHHLISQMFSMSQIAKYLGLIAGYSFAMLFLYFLPEMPTNELFGLLMILVAVLYLFIYTETDMTNTLAEFTRIMREHIKMGKLDQISKIYRLTERERDVFRLLGKGRSTQRIAQKLFLAEGTVNVHQYHIFKKLGVRSRQELLDVIEKYQLKDN
jgi:DNA-binding CsgD family transcriptional regulator